ncbi:hypothetical protein H4684_003697 [Desulfomicrobium macestii]|uniref:Uncharacterized protein n=1 Tax=Desulfomicrobium macestii TaxID=90731 RepID=A0ABR9H8G0_9BACT|nr:hypothetical protein [Desulfomicrobium macestii]
MVAVMVMVINARDPTRARACASLAAAGLVATATPQLKSSRPSGLYAALPAAVCRRCRGLPHALITAFLATHLISQRNI